MNPEKSRAFCATLRGCKHLPSPFEVWWCPKWWVQLYIVPGAAVPGKGVAVVAVRYRPCSLILTTPPPETTLGDKKRNLITGQVCHRGSLDTYPQGE